MPPAARNGARNPALTLCLITDRKRLCAAVGEPLTAWRAILLSQVEGAIAGGVDVVQIREPDLAGGALAAFVRQCVSLVQGTSTRVVVNDRADVALAAGAHGIHLRESGIPIEAARQLLGPTRVVGRSVHTAEAAVQSRTADYVIVGSVFETASKSGASPRLGLAGLASVVAAAGDCPVWAIGGITPERLRPLHACGASGIAAIGAFIPPAHSRQLAAAVKDLTQQLRFSL